ncbi:hypothetical protein FB451DRAFT_1412359 [Mycena latifolia]|nr:hypothetical protein FB451DRAFT_1412359 [Mycena latifolia]
MSWRRSRPGPSIAAPRARFYGSTGTAGAGKSAIAQTFAGDCHSQERLGGSFFFRRGHQKRGTWHGLITTLAYQLVKAVPEFLLPLEEALNDDQLVVGRAMTVQFNRLLVEPFANTPALPFTPIIVLDGLDECAGHKDQHQILRLFAEAIRLHQLPIRLLITSRPEPHIREILETREMLEICHQSVLSADKAAFEDIRSYLRDEFCRIQSEYGVRGIDLGGSHWPPPGTVDHLVMKSSGIFVYAATVIRFVDDEYSHPQERLQAVLQLDQESTAPLDDLYTTIISTTPPQPQKLLRILHAIWQCSLPHSGKIDPEEIDALLTFLPGTCRLLIRGLHSLFDVPPVRTRFGSRRPIRVLHASLSDYLSNPRRSGMWCVSMLWLRSDYLHCTIRLLSSPPLTDARKAFHSEVVERLPKFLPKSTPSESLLILMRNRSFWESLFLVAPMSGEPPWPRRGSPYPSDLIQLREDHTFISVLSHDLQLSRQPRPTFQFDSLYTYFFTRHPEVLFVLRTQIVLPCELFSVLRFLGWTFNVFRPLLEFRHVFRSSFPTGDSPVDFLENPGRAGALYCDPQDIVEKLLLLWIWRVKVFLGGSDFWVYPNWLELLRGSQTNSQILIALETLDLSEFCNQMASDRSAHLEAHRYILYPNIFLGVLDWLRVRSRTAA